MAELVEVKAVVSASLVVCGTEGKRRLLVLKSESLNMVLSSRCLREPRDWGRSPSTLKRILSRTCSLLTLGDVCDH